MSEYLVGAVKVLDIIIKCVFLFMCITEDHYHYTNWEIAGDLFLSVVFAASIIITIGGST
jgi:hypothetical protein